jgi:peptidoglycan/xylan/chitin deacetylase (PgdA/CDA1 family)
VKAGVQTGTIGVDVEDWFHPELVRARVPAGDARSVVERGTDALLEMFARHGVKSTFFLLGEVASRHPGLVRRIAGAGHEIACHGMTHRPLWSLDRESFRAELRGFRAAVRAVLGGNAAARGGPAVDTVAREGTRAGEEDSAHPAPGREIAVGYRAPTFSLDRSTAWALEVLYEEGFRYDSSVFPARSSLYGVPGAPLGIYRPSARDLARHDPAGPIVEFPVAILALGPIRVPAAGGFYLRALPWPALRMAIDRIARERPFALYLHPWECVPGLPRVHLAPAASFVTYLNLDSVLGKLERLLRRYRFVPMREVLEAGGHLART